MSIVATLNRARKAVKRIEAEANNLETLNQCEVVTEWNEPLTGQLVILLHPDLEAHDKQEARERDNPLR